MPKSAPPPGHSRILDYITQVGIPSIEQGGMSRVVVAQKSWRDLVLPAGVKLSHKKLVGRPTGMHGPRLSGSASGPLVRWVPDDQEAIRRSILLFVAAGDVDYQLGNYVLHCSQGSFIFIPPGVPHPKGVRSHLEGENRRNGSCDLVWFHAQGRRVQCWMCSSRGEVHTISAGNENLYLLNDNLAALLVNMQEEAAWGYDDHERLFALSLQLFLLTVRRELNDRRYLQLGVVENDDPGLWMNADPMERAREYIQTHLSGTLTIDTVARAVHMSRAQFTRRFLRATGQTFVEYVSDRRIELAQVLLRETDWSAVQISEFVGLRSASHFHSLFRRKTGSSPLRYRTENQTAGE